mgnify:CR=1 FL=1
MYDFRRCKLCGEEQASPKYRLKRMTLYCCGHCDFHFIDALDNFPAEQQDGNLLTAEARSYIERKLPQNTLQLEKNLRFVQSHVAPEGLRCLDIGSGAGVFPDLLQKAGAVAEGIEPQQVFREFAREKYRIVLASELIDDPRWQKQSRGAFDVATLWDTLEHVNFPAETIQAICSVLRPGGYLFLDTPCRDSLFYRASEWSHRLSLGTRPLLLNTLYSAGRYGHKQIFTMRQLQNLLERSGFSVLGRSGLHRSRNKLVLACRKQG